MNGENPDVRAATFYGQHGVFDTEANINNLETDARRNAVVSSTINELAILAYP